MWRVHISISLRIHVELQVNWFRITHAITHAGTLPYHVHTIDRKSWLNLSSLETMAQRVLHKMVCFHPKIYLDFGIIPASRKSLRDLFLLGNNDSLAVSRVQFVTQIPPIDTDSISHSIRGIAADHKSKKFWMDRPPWCCECLKIALHC